MAAVVAFPSVAPVPEEQRMLIPATWKEYVVLRDLMDGPGLRMTYLKGSLELMSPSRAHEMWKKNIARLVELFAHRRGVELYGYGSATFKKEMADRGAEPDECYLIGHELRDYPHIVLEVIHSSPLVNKLDVYAPMGVQEVWVFRDGAFQIFTLAADGTYGESPSGGSNLLPDLNFAMVARYAVRSDTPRALREFEQEIDSAR